MKTLAEAKIELNDEWEKAKADLREAFSITIEEAREKLIREFKVPRCVIGRHDPIPLLWGTYRWLATFETLLRRVVRALC